ncbi:MAG: signal peptidase II [Bacteroidota bacterium]
MRALYVTVFIIISDQISKLMVKGITIPFLHIDIQGLQLGSSRPIIGDFLRLTYIENPGMAFGIDLGGKLFFSFISIIASIAIIMYLYKVRNESLAYRISLSMILGGAIGNLIDRTFYGIIFNEGTLFHGRVVDFIDADFFNVNLFGYHLSRWPVFNIADASVTCGVILLLLVHRHVTHEETLSPVPAAGGIFTSDQSNLPPGQTIEPNQNPTDGGSKFGQN